MDSAVDLIMDGIVEVTGEFVSALNDKNGLSAEKHDKMDMQLNATFSKFLSVTEFFLFLNALNYNSIELSITHRETSDSIQGEGTITVSIFQYIVQLKPAC